MVVSRVTVFRYIRFCGRLFLGTFPVSVWSSHLFPYFVFINRKSEFFADHECPFFIVFKPLFTSHYPRPRQQQAGQNIVVFYRHERSCLAPQKWITGKKVREHGWSERHKVIIENNIKHVDCFYILFSAIEANMGARKYFLSKSTIIQLFMSFLSRDRKWSPLTKDSFLYFIRLWKKDYLSIMKITWLNESLTLLWYLLPPDT